MTASPAVPEPFEELLDHCRRAGLDAPVARRLDAYLDLLERWNRVHNLTSVTGRGNLVRRHLLDSLAVLPHLAAGSVVDVGSGAGLPGVPLAVARPGLAVSLVESRGKRVRFLRHVAGALGLANVAVIHGRVEDHTPAAGHANVVARAFGPLATLVEGSAHLLAPGGRWLALKGRRPDGEIAALPPGYHARSVALDVPGASSRHLVIVEAA